MKIAPVELLIFQATPFCNLNCGYCYLPNRKDRRIIDLETVRVTVERLSREGLLSPSFSIVWHSGEPMVVSRDAYSKYFQIIRETLGPPYAVRHHFQTNGTLINDTWCDFIREHNLSIGVSIDGPEYIHDLERRTWGSRGSFRQVMKGIERLRANGVVFHTISVVGNASLDFPSEIYEFLVSLEPDFIGFNVEEQEGAHLTTSVADHSERVERFFRTIYKLAKANGFAPPIREFESAYLAIQEGKGSCRNAQIAPFRILSVAVDGGFTTFSPELLGMSSPAYGSLNLGNILTDSPRAIARSDKLLTLLKAVQAGVNRCKETCDYFELCGGGTPSNKLFEKGSFDVAATRFCESSIKAPLRIVLDDLESVLMGNGKINAEEEIDFVH